MNDTSLTRGQSLTNAELCTKLGAELLSLCQSVTADGRMAPEELDALKQWLSDAARAAHDSVAQGSLVRIAGVVLLLVLLGPMAAWFRT